MNFDLELLKAQMMVKEKELKEGKSTDYIEGFDDACRLLSIYLGRMMGKESEYEALLSDDSEGV